jgi:hypothetical protein
VVSIAATRFVIVVLDGGLVVVIRCMSSSDVRVILWFNLIKVTSSSYLHHHQLSPSSCHCRCRLNISYESKDVSNWSSSSTFIAVPRNLDRIVCIASTSIQHALFWMPFFRHHEGLETVKIPPLLVACPIVALLQSGGVMLADLCLPYDANVVGTMRMWVSERQY